MKTSLFLFIASILFTSTAARADDLEIVICLQKRAHSIVRLVSIDGRLELHTITRGPFTKTAPCEQEVAAIYRCFIGAKTLRIEARFDPETQRNLCVNL